MLKWHSILIKRLTRSSNRRLKLHIFANRRKKCASTPLVSLALSGRNIRDLSVEKLLIGTAGVVLGATLTFLREFWRDNRDQKKKSEYLAIRAVCILERFIDGCVSVALDDGERNEQHCLRTTTSRPGLDFEELDVEWQALPFDLMYEILNFPSDLEQASGKIDSVAEYVAFPPDYEEVFEERQFQYSSLGLKANDLTVRLRAKYGMPKKVYEHWDPIARIEKVKRDIEATRLEREKKHAEISKIA